MAHHKSILVGRRDWSGTFYHISPSGYNTCMSLGFILVWKQAWNHIFLFWTCEGKWTSSIAYDEHMMAKGKEGMAKGKEGAYDEHLMAKGKEENGQYN